MGVDESYNNDEKNNSSHNMECEQLRLVTIMTTRIMVN